jgi:hypothetical protein
VKASHRLSSVPISFDETNLVPAAGLIAPAALAQQIGLAQLFSERLNLGKHGANSDIKALTVMGSVLAGGDSIDDTGFLRTGATCELLGEVRAPSTIGTWLRDFGLHNARELDAISRELLRRLWQSGAGPTDLSANMTMDMDSTIVEVAGPDKQGAAFGYTKVRGYHPLLATSAETGQVLASRMRGGNAGAARAAGSFLTETVSRVRNAGATGELTIRADSAFYSRAVLSAAEKLGVRFSITVRQDKRIARAIAAIPEEDWQPIPYWSSTAEVSAADVAETTYTCFAGSKSEKITVRLVVRRTAPIPGSQLALLTDWAYHGFVTDRDLDLFEVEADHRRHAIVEQNIAELKSAGLAHFPSGKFAANAAWLGLSVMAHNLGRGVGILAGEAMARATAMTLRLRLFTIPGRLVKRGRRKHLRLPDQWPWADAFNHAMTAIAAIPAPT